MLQVANVSFAYEKHLVLSDVSFDLAPGGLLGILGPNGSGKTTLLRLLGGLLRPSAGQIVLDGRDLGSITKAGLAKRMAMVPQETYLAFDYSVLEVALMGRYPHLRTFEVEGPEDVEVARAAAVAQRVVIASALAQFGRRATDTGRRPVEVLLLDEPTTSLDLGYQLDIASTIRRLNNDRSTAIVISTHDLNFAASVCEQVVLLRQGCVLAAGPIHEILRPDTVKDLYNVDAVVEQHATAGHLTIVPLARRAIDTPYGHNE